MPSRMRTTLATLGLVAVVMAVSAWLQAQTPHLVDRDSYLHARLALRLPEAGLSRELPYGHATILADAYADKEVLFHALLAPLVRLRGDPLLGAKVGVVLLNGAVALALLLALRSAGAPGPALLAALLLACGNHALFRLQMTRPHLLSIVWLLLGLACLLSGRRRWLVAVGVLYAWSYAAPHLLVFAAGLLGLGRVLGGDPWREAAKDAGLAAAGVALGLLLHPYTPQTLAVFWAQNVHVLAEAWGPAAGLGVRMGAEFSPVTTRSLLLTSGGALLAITAGVLATMTAPSRPRPLTVGLFTLALGFLALAMVAAKPVEYLPPVAILFLGAALADALRDRAPSRLPVALGISLALALLLPTLAVTRAAVAATPRPALEGAARWLDANAAPGDVVAHLSWADASTLAYFAPRQRALVAMDPVFLALRDPEGARLLEDTREGRRPLDPRALRARFGARWLVVDATRGQELTGALYAGLEPVFEDEGGAVFSLGGE